MSLRSFDSIFSRLSTWLRSVVRRNRFEAEMEAELAHHLEILTVDLIRAGHTPSQAARRAQRTWRLECFTWWTSGQQRLSLSRLSAVACAESRSQRSDRIFRFRHERNHSRGGAARPGGDRFR